MQWMIVLYSIAPHWAGKGVFSWVRSHLYISLLQNTPNIEGTTSQSNTTESTGKFMKITSSSSPSTSNTVMSEEINNNVTGKSLQEKIEKLRDLIQECSSSNTRKQQDKCDKLRQKLRYLEYYQSYDLGACPGYVN